jgi:hypothetical protein
MMAKEAGLGAGFFFPGGPGGNSFGFQSIAGFSAN